MKKTIMFLICLIPFLYCAQANDLEPIQPKGRTVMSKWYGVLDYALHNPIKTLGAIALICTIPSVEANDCKKAAKDLWGVFPISSWERNSNMGIYNVTGEVSPYYGNLLRNISDVDCEVLMPHASDYVVLCCSLFPTVRIIPDVFWNKQVIINFDWPYLKTLNTSHFILPVPSSFITCSAISDGNNYSISVLEDNQTFFSSCLIDPNFPSLNRKKKS